MSKVICSMASRAACIHDNGRQPGEKLKCVAHGGGTGNTVRTQPARF